MARNTYCRLCLNGTLVTQSPLHVGGYGDDVDTDLPLARDGTGQLYVPGTSLAGALRSFAEQLFDQQFIDQLWGYQRDDDGHASFVMIDDAAIENADRVLVEVRDHVGIDRQYGCAAENIKYDRAILPRGTKLTLRVSVEVPDTGTRSKALAMLAVLKEAMEAGEVRLGAAKTRGLGRIKLENASLTEQSFGSRDGILAAVQQAGGVAVPQADIATARQAHPPRSRPRLAIEIRWQPRGPIMVKAGLEGIAADMLPLVSRINGGIALVLPGSSIKGAFRFQAERIIRTLRRDLRPPWLGTEGKRKFLDAVEVELVNELFGRRGERVEPNDQRAWLPGLGALFVADCYGQRPLTPAQWQAIEAANDDRELRRALHNAGLQDWSHTYHVAIDRWLGSAAESMLYTVLEPHRTQWEPIQLEVNLLRLPENLQLAAVALLLLVLRDLANDRLPLGFATHRGMGSVHVNSVVVRTHDLHGDLAALSQVQFQNGRFANVPRPLEQAWQDWVRQGVRA